jgi:hypothetical protein
MRNTNRTIQIFVIAAVLLAALGIGVCIKQFRMQDTGTDSEFGLTMPDELRRLNHRNLSSEERAKLRKQREQMLEKMENLTEEEKKKFRAQMRKRFNVEGQRDKPMFFELSEQEKERLRLRWQEPNEQREALKFMRRPVSETEQQGEQLQQPAEQQESEESETTVE